MFKKYLPYQAYVPCPREGEEDLPCPAPQTSVRCLGFEAPVLSMDLAGITAMWICRFPGVLPADIITASVFVLLNRAPTLELPSNYCSQLLGAQEPTLITEYPANEAAVC